MNVMPGPPCPSRAAKVKAGGRDGHIEKPIRPGTIGTHQIRMQQTVAEVTGRGGEHRLHVIRRERDVAYLDIAEVRANRVILSMTFSAITFLS
jgi:hypothetical protein